MTHCLRVRKGVADDLDGLSACKEELSVLGSHTPVHLNHQTPVTTFCLEMQFSPNCGILASTLQHWRPLCPLWESRRISVCWAQSQEGKNVWDASGQPSPQQDNRNRKQEGPRRRDPEVLSKAVKARTVLAVITLHLGMALPIWPFYLRF